MTSPAPRRRHSPAVYRRRRLVAVLLAVLVIAGIVALVVWAPWNGAPAARTTPAATPSATPSASPSASPTEEAPPESADPAASDAADDAAAPAAPTVAECTAGNVEVSPLTDKTTYAAGDNPNLSISLTNHGDVPCTMNVGTATQSFTITSGDDVWWRSTDCQSEPSDQIVTLEAGQSVTSVTPVVWDRTRSSVSTCDAQRPVAPGGGASFHLSVSIGGVESAGTAQFFLN